MTCPLAIYQKGAITADHLAVECLNIVDPADPASVLGALPDEFPVRMVEFARRYRPDGMVTNYGARHRSLAGWAPPDAS